MNTASDVSRCQSCGMLLGPGCCGTEIDGTESHTYCKLCYMRGDFIEPGLLLEDILVRSIERMTDELHMPEAEAERRAKEVIPGLRRWKREL